MRTTVRIDDDLMREIKELAAREKQSLARLINRLLRRALEAPHVPRARREYRQKTFRMGASTFDLNKALAVASDLEDEEILRKLALRK